MHLGEMRRRILSGVDSEFPSSQRRGSRQRLEILVSGWAYPRVVRNSKRPSSFGYSLSHSGVPGTRCKVGTTLRARFQDPSRQGGILAIGRAELVDMTKIQTRLFSKPTNFTVDDVEGELVREIRSIAENPHSGVGTDVMSVNLTPFPVEVAPHIRYFRDASIRDDRMGHTPAFVAPGLVAPAAEMNASLGMQFVFNADTPDEWKYELDAVPKWLSGVPLRYAVRMGKTWP
jgi:hypothetical protein